MTSAVESRPDLTLREIPLPEIPHSQLLLSRVPGPLLRGAIKSVIAFSDENDYRPVLACVSFVLCGGALDLYAADGSRLARASIGCECVPTPTMSAFLLDRGAVKQLARLLVQHTRVYCWEADGGLIFYVMGRKEDRAVLAAPRPFTYPKVAQLWPETLKAKPAVCVVSTAELRGVVAAALKAGGGESRVLRFWLKPRQELRWHSQMIGEDAAEGGWLQTRCSGPSRYVALNAHLLRDVVKAAPGEALELRVYAKNAQVAFSCPGRDDWRAILMPMFLSEPAVLT